MRIILCDCSKFLATAFKVLQMVWLNFDIDNDDCNPTIHLNRDKVICAQQVHVFEVQVLQLLTFLLIICTNNDRKI